MNEWMSERINKIMMSCVQIVDWSSMYTFNAYLVMCLTIENIIKVALKILFLKDNILVLKGTF